MREIAEMTERIVKKAKEYDRDTVPGDYVTLTTPCPTCGGQVRENYRRFACTGADGQGEGCGFSFGKTPAGRAFELHEVEALLANKQVGPLEGFRSKAGWPFTAEIVLKFNEEERNWKLEFNFGDDKSDEDSGELVEFGDSAALGACPKCGAAVREHGNNYVCEKSVPTHAQPTPSCDFKTGKIILQQPVSIEQVQKLLSTGKTDLLDKFISMRTRRPFKAFLAWNAEAGKVAFEFEPRTSKYPPRQRAGAAAGAAAKPAGKAPAKTTKAGAKSAAKKTATAKTPKAPRKPAAGKAPSAALAAVIGNEPVARTEVIKKLWEYIRANGLQDAADKRKINADDKLRPVFGKDQVTMFELAKVVGPHLG
jgi:DNA topoisomerase-3